MALAPAVVVRNMGFFVYTTGSCLRRDSPRKSPESRLKWRVVRSCCSIILSSDEDGTAAGVSPFQVAFDHDNRTADMLNDRSLCQIREDIQDNAPPTTSVGTHFEAPPVGEHRLDVSNTISPHGQDDDMGFLNSPSQSLSFSSDAVSDQSSLCGLHLSKAHTLELIKDFQEEAEALYPFIDLQEINELVENLSHRKTSPQKAVRDSQTDSWNDLDDTRNRDLLRLTLACALAAKEKKKTEMSQNLMNTAEAHSFSRLRMPKIDFKDLAIATMLVRTLKVPGFACDSQLKEHIPLSVR
jgi:hypothetical protein